MSTDANNNDKDNNHNLPTKKEKVIEPLHDLKTTETLSDASAVNLIREKLNAIYADEPDAKEELKEDSAHHGRRSKHQQFMHELSGSGKSLADIQTAWHAYYIELPDSEKHQVWQEFYSNYNKPSAKKAPEIKSLPKVTNIEHETNKPKVTTKDPRAKKTIPELKSEIIARASNNSLNNKPSHLSSIRFGLATGLLVMFIMMFGFFNERFVAPFITPSRSISATPLIVDENEKVGPEPKLVIPKINVDVPVVYDENSIEEKAVQDALEDGVLHYATTPNPGEFGNSVIFGHSSNNIFNSGAYKYVFVQLNKMNIGDTFYIHRDGVRYVYKIYEKKVVEPEEVSVLGKTEKPATMTLITCDPPGTALRRLVVIGEQISPNTSENDRSSVNVSSTPQPEILASNAPSLWQRFVGWLF